MSEKRLTGDELIRVTGGNGVILVDNNDNNYPSPTLPGEEIPHLRVSLSASGKDRGGTKEEDEQVLW